MKNRAILIFILMLTMTALLAIPVGASTAEEYFEYYVSDDGAVITKYTGTDKNVVVPATLGGYPVYSIGTGAFRYNNTMETLTISEGICRMESESVFGCSTLRSVHFPSTLELVPYPDAFLRTGITTIPTDCDALETVTVAEGNTNIVVYDGALYTKDMKFLLMLPSADPREIFYVAEGVTDIISEACANNKNLKEVVLPSSLKTIQYWCFIHDVNLEKINLPENCTFIGQYTFQNTALTSIHIPAALTNIAQGAFGSNCLLETITVAPANPVYYAIDNVLYASRVNGIAVAKYPAGSEATEFTVPDGVANIDRFAFDSASNLKKVTLPDSLKLIGYSAFSYCDNLEGITLPNGLKEIEGGAFFDCYKFRSIVIPKSVTYLGNYIFANVELDEIIFMGDAPSFESSTLTSAGNTIAYYPEGNGTWTADVMQDYGGTITWKSYALKNGWVKENGSWYYYVDNVKQTGWKKINGYWYYMDKNGVMQTGWEKINGYWYYMSAGGVMQTGWQKIDTNWYYFASGGAMQTGWQKINGHWYYFASGGTMQTGWVKDGGYWFYLNKSGVMQTGWVKDGDYWFYMNKSGVMQTGWVKDGDYWFYMNKSGVMLTGTHTIGGKTYTFNKSGVWIG